MKTMVALGPLPAFRSRRGRVSRTCGCKCGCPEEPWGGTAASFRRDLGLVEEPKMRPAEVLSGTVDWLSHVKSIEPHH